MTRHKEPGAHRNLIGLKVSDDMLALIEAARGTTPIQEYLRAVISSSVQAEGHEDWERRAREAERKLEQVREALGDTSEKPTAQPPRLVRM